jgi:hypothetical protein
MEASWQVGKHDRYTRSMLEAWLAEQRAGGDHAPQGRSA